MLHEHRRLIPFLKTDGSDKIISWRTASSNGVPTGVNWCDVVPRELPGTGMAQGMMDLRLATDSTPRPPTPNPRCLPGCLLWDVCESWPSLRPVGVLLVEILSSLYFFAM